MKTRHSNSTKSKRVGIDTTLLKKFGGEERRVRESKQVLDILAELADDKLQAVLNQILDEPRSVENWEHQIATLIGEAKIHKYYRNIYTIKGENS